MKEGEDPTLEFKHSTGELKEIMPDGGERNMSTPYYQVCFMPWAGLDKELKLGPVTFWPFPMKTEGWVADTAIREYLARYFRCYVDHQGRPVETVTICSHRPADFRRLGENQVGEIRAAVDALIFSIICPATKTGVCANNYSMGPPSAERYQLITQNFHPGEDSIAVQAGSVRSTGWKIGQISFPKPWSTGGAFASPDPCLLEAFTKFFEPGFLADEMKERILRSLEWFRFAHIGSDDVSWQSKIVMMATAFEIALDVPDQPNKKSWIADRLDMLCGTEGMLREDRSIGRSQINHTKIGWWGWDFYQLRNEIVHGDVIRPEQLRYLTPAMKWLTQPIVADLVFWECVTRELYAHGCLGDDVKKYSAEFDKLFPDQPSGGAEPVLLAGLMGFGFSEIHRAFGWAPELRRVQ